MGDTQIDNEKIEKHSLGAEQKESVVDGLRIAKSYLNETMDKIDLKVDPKKRLSGLPSGFKTLDKLTNGFQKSDLIIVAGRPAMGKTIFAMNIAEYAAIHNDRPVLVFSIELPASQLLMRILASIGGVNASRLRTGKLDDYDCNNLSMASNIIKNNFNMFIDDSPRITTSEILSRARQIAGEYGDLAAIIIDPLQLITMPEINENKTAEITRSLKALAKELQVPVIVLSKLKSALEQREDHRPVISDLSDSDAIEQDADIIAFIYRDEVYNKDTTSKAIAEITLGKHRKGELATVFLEFQGHYYRFKNIS